MTVTQPVRHLGRLAIVLALLLLGFAGLFAWQTWRAEKADQISQLRTVLALGERAVDQYFVQMEASLKGLSDDLISADGQLDDLNHALDRLQRFKALHPDLTTVTLASLDGQVLVTTSSNRPSGLPDMGQEASFVGFLADLTPQTTLILSRPMFGPLSRQWIIPGRYVVRDRQGQAVALLVASLPVPLLQTFWRNAPIMSRATVGLLRDDGYLLSRFPVATDTSLEERYGKPRDGTLREHLRAQHVASEGYIEGVEQPGSTEYGTAFARLSHYPLTMFVAMPLQEFRNAWWEVVRVPFALLMLLFLLSAAMVRDTERRQTLWTTEREQAEGALLASEREQRFMLDNLQAGVAVFDPQGTLVSVNAQACRLLGLTEEQLRGHRFIDPAWRVLRQDGTLMPPSEDPVARVLATHQPAIETLGVVVQTRSSETLWMIANAYPVFDAAGKLRSAVVTFVDISARVRAEHELEQSERRYRMLFDNSMDAVLLSKPDGTILNANAAACAMFGMTEADLRKRGRSAFVDTSDPRLQGLMEERRRHGRVTGVLAMLRGDGSRFEAEISSSIYVDQPGQERTSIVIRDVSDRRRTEAALMAKELAERANRAKSEFIARISHELRTPLNAILGFSEVLQLDTQHPLTRDQQQRLVHVRRAGDHLLQLINDLLDLSRIEAGALKVHFDDVDVLQTVHDAVRELATQADARNVRISVEAPARRLIAARGDHTRLRQVILNLLSNAIKYNRAAGQVTVRLEADATRLRLSVHDNGLGMSIEQVGALFQPFNRLGRELSAIEGTGIGLVISRSLVELMGGTLTASSEPGAGSEFTVELPLAAPTTALAGDAAQLAPAHSVRNDVSGSVLYIDDDEVNRLLVQAFLGRRPGVTLSTASDGYEGLAMARELRPDIMLVDLMMPGMSGLELVKALRADESLRRTPCLAVSANAMPDEISEALAAGFDDYLTKPLSSQVLLAEIDRRLAERSSHQLTSDN